MGCCTSCCPKSKRDYEVIEGGERTEGGGGGGGGEGRGGGSKRGSEDYSWEKEFLQDRAMRSGFVSHCAIVSFPSGTFRASAPPTFHPNPTGIHDIISGLQGDTSGLEERSVALGGQTPVCTPGKIDGGRAMYCNDGNEGGCVVTKTKECLLVVFYPGNTEAALTLASELAEFMEESGR